MQDWFESLAAGEPELFQRYGTFTQTADTEVTSWPSGLLRLDDLWYMDTTATPNLPAWRLDPIHETGGHMPSMNWAELVSVTRTTGKPRRYWASQPPIGRIFWEQLPDAANTIRYYGLVAAANFTVRTETFEYPDSVAPTFAQQAAKILRMGRDDSIEALRTEAASSLLAAMQGCRHWWNVGPVGREYVETHDT